MKLDTTRIPIEPRSHAHQGRSEGLIISTPDRASNHDQGQPEGFSPPPYWLPEKDGSLASSESRGAPFAKEVAERFRGVLYCPCQKLDRHQRVVCSPGDLRSREGNRRGAGSRFDNTASMGKFLIPPGQSLGGSRWTRGRKTPRFPPRTILQAARRA